MSERFICPTPAYDIAVDGTSIASKIDARLQSLTVTDNRGLESDTIELVLDDSDGLVDLPARGAKLRCWLGWEGQSLVDKGSYTVTGVAHSGVPDQVTIRATAADLRGTLAGKRERSWHNTTLGVIVTKIAKEHGLKPVIADGLAKRPVKHLDQTSESDINLLTRLAKHHDAVITIKDGRLLAIYAGNGVTASGKPLPTIEITRVSGDRHHFEIADRDQASTIKATYQNTRSGKRGSVTYSGPEAEVEARKAKTKSKAINADTGNTVTLRHVYATKANAQRAAKSAWNKAQRGAATFSITLAYGRPDALPECPVKVSGWKPIIDNQTWLATRLVHSLSDGGLTTQVELEVKASLEADDASASA